MNPTQVVPEPFLDPPAGCLAYAAGPHSWDLESHKKG